MEDFLRLLGHDLSSTISIRAFYPRTDSRAKTDKSKKHFDLGLKMAIRQAQKLNAEGRSVYVIVNGPGKEDKDIKVCRALFYEHDELSKELSVGLWEGLGLPRPSFQVDTGGKSIHSYWVLNKPIAPDLWKPLQTDLIEFADGDRQCKNPSRVMRCPGYVHPETGQMAALINVTEQRYSFDELRTIVPVVEREAPRVALDAIASNGHISDDGVSIAAFLAVHNRRILDGVSEGSRNGSLHKLGLDLVGVERWLQQEGIYPRDRAWDLFYGACAKCNPPMGSVGDDPQPDEFWLRIVKDSNGPSLSDDKLRNILNAKTRKPMSKGDRNGHGGSAGGELSAKFNKELKSRTSTEPEKKKSHFESSPNEGLKYIKVTYDKQGKVEPEEEIYVGNHLIALASARSPYDDGYQIQVELKNRNGLKTLTIPKVLIEGEGKEALELLVDNGYSYYRESRKLLLGYLSRLGDDVDQEYIISGSTGWVNNAFVLPDRSFGNNFLRFQKVELPRILEYEEKGTLEEWKQNVAIKAQLNSRLTFALGVSFSAPLNPILNVESGGWHFFGATSGGKTATLKFAASVYGAPKRRISSWRTTSNSLEYKCVAHNHLTLFLDEVGQALPQDVAASAYMISNGQGKNRLSRHLTQREVPKWETVFFSTGEHTLTSYLEQGGIKTKGGQENRMPSIPICPRDGINSAFENTHGLKPIEFVSELEENADKYTGTAFSAFMNHLVSSRDNEYDANLVSRHTEIRNELITTHEQTNVLLRVADRMAVVQLGLEIAAKANVIPSGITPSLVKTVFDDWVRSRGGAKDFELMRQCEAIEHLFVTNEFSDRIAISENIDILENSEKTIRKLLAYKCNDGYLVPPTIFKSFEFAGEVNLKILIQELIKREWLIPSKDSPTTVKKIAGKARRGYFFAPFWK